MPALLNQRRETFCRKIIEAAKRGLPQTWAYEQSGYKGTGHTAEMAASRLMSFDEIRTRIAELGAPAVRKTRVSIESLLNELETTIADARTAKQHGVVIQALTLSAKLVGLLRERIEVGTPQDYAALQGDDIVSYWLENMAEEPADALAILDAMRAGLLDKMARGAVLVDDVKPASTRRIDEADPELLATLR